MKGPKLFVALLAAFVLLPCCKKEEAPAKEDKIVLGSLESPQMFFNAEGGSMDLKFLTSNSDWTITSSADWLSVSPDKGTPGTRTVKVTATKNGSTQAREAVLKIVCGTKAQDITVQQNGNPAAAHLYKIVAHRGGYLENGLPACSVASLKKTISQFCYGSECDIMWTADNDVIVCHPENNMINGLVPSSHTLAEIQAAGLLSNGEKVPSLRDFLAVVTDRNINRHGTKLWLDVKGSNAELQEKVMKRAAEIAKECNASAYVEFLVPSGYSYTSIKTYMTSNYGINCAWNGHIAAASAYGEGGWAQLPYSDYRSSAYWPPTALMDAGVTLSIYHTPSKVGSCASFYKDVFPYYGRMKAIFVNFPEDTIDQLVKGGYETRVVE